MQTGDRSAGVQRTKKMRYVPRGLVKTSFLDWMLWAGVGCEKKLPSLRADLPRIACLLVLVGSEGRVTTR